MPERDHANNGGKTADASLPPILEHEVLTAGRPCSLPALEAKWWDELDEETLSGQSIGSREVSGPCPKAPRRMNT